MVRYLDSLDRNKVVEHVGTKQLLFSFLSTGLEDDMNSGMNAGVAGSVKSTAAGSEEEEVCQV